MLLQVLLIEKFTISRASKFRLYPFSYPVFLYIVIYNNNKKIYTYNFCCSTDEGMEMQMLKVGGAPATGSDNESVTSLEYHKPNNSTIGTIFLS